MTRESLEIQRLKHAKRAFDIRVLGEPHENKQPEYNPSPEEFRSAAEAAPFMLRSLGLGAGIASLAAKEGQRKVLAALIACWLRDCPHCGYYEKSRNHSSDNSNQNADDKKKGDKEKGDSEAIGKLLREIGSKDRRAYRGGQIEAIAYAIWLKRLAQAFCAKEGQ